MPVVKPGDILRITTRMKNPLSYLLDSEGNELYTIIVNSVTDYDNNRQYVSYRPYATKECPHDNWCGHGCISIPNGELIPKEFGLQAVKVIGHVDNWGNSEQVSR